VGGCGLDSSDSRYRLMAEFCEYDNTLSCFINFLEFRENLNHDMLLENDSDPFCQLD
jgi:hypothetical protein